MDPAATPHRARGFVRELEVYWKFQTLHPEVGPGHELALFLGGTYGSQQRVVHVTVFDAYSLLVTFDGSAGTAIVPVEQGFFVVRRLKLKPHTELKVLKFDQAQINDANKVPRRT